MRDSESNGAKRKLRIGVLASGSGSNMQAIHDAIVAGELDAEIVAVISDVKDARVHQRAKDAGYESVYVDPGPYKTKLGEAAQKEIADRLKAAGVDLVCLAGFMRMVKPPLLDAFEGRMVNIHPSLLPAFKGLHAWKQAVEAGATESGCTVHYVDAGMDTGSIIDQESVPVLADDTAESLHARIQEKEHILYPRAIRSIADKLLGE
ncbi:phosphoribosylglycinamide formyltransferase [Sulfuriroseicoccus oceanibius]|uniref:Phosphoribosylglycinamide formyltransferase n=2 Tax=Sulfuriroseicoccus oceanibius TaxID=2707525 RepID=A0A6B3L8L5_9BACT|nr:phosphoribosylglycinamide formyltransferase [Sulfuriroseicoccus oceanibius]